MQEAKAKPLSTRPEMAFTIGLVIVAILLTPAILRRWISLDWNIGNMAYPAIALQVGCGMLAVLLFLARRQLARLRLIVFPSTKRAVFVAILVTFAVILVLVTAEIAFRIIDYPFKARWTPSENTLARFDDDLGWSYIPDRSYDRPMPDGTSLVTHFNNIGARVRRSQQPTNPQTPSVLFVGCSFTMGHGVSFEDSLPGQFEDRADPHDLQAVNLGVQAFGTDQALLQLERHIGTVNTKGVVYTFIDGHINRNAVHDRRMLVPHARFLGTKPRFAVRPSGELYQRDLPQRYEAFSRLRLGELLAFKWTLWGPRPRPDVTRTMVERMAQRSKEQGAPFVIVYWTWRPPAAERVDAFFGSIKPNLVIPAIGAPRGWSGWQLWNDEHPNPRAHAYVARLVREKLHELGSATSEKN
jgi:hypothetical protein